MLEIVVWVWTAQKVAAAVRLRSSCEKASSLIIEVCVCCVTVEGLQAEHSRRSTMACIWLDFTCQDFTIHFHSSQSWRTGLTSLPLVFETMESQSASDNELLSNIILLMKKVTAIQTILQWSRQTQSPCRQPCWFSQETESSQSWWRASIRHVDLVQK